MKNRILFVLTIMALLAAPATSHAGFLVKKQTTAQTAAVSTPAATTTVKEKSELREIMDAITDPLSSPSKSFVGMIERGTISVIAFIFGVAGFFIPIFAIVALVFGFLGFSKKYFRKKGYGVAAFILGLIAIGIMAFGGLAPLPFF